MLLRQAPLLLVAIVSIFCEMPAALSQQQLERDLLSTSVKQLAVQVNKLGDPARGAVLFHSPSVGCTQCHRVDAGTTSVIGPNLSVWNTSSDKPWPSTAESVIESILRPSAVIAKEYASTRILTTDGKVYSGVVTKRDANELQLRFGPKPEDQATVSIEDIEREAASEISLMPSGLVQQLDDQNQFLDLVAYVLVIAKEGPSRAAQLTPKPEQLKPKLPEYESHVDHASLISGWNKKSLERGQKVYNGLCINCHGNRETVGSLPTALRFGSGKFKQGSDPFSIYKTLTHGSGLMLPQKWMVPKQKYDVIHYIREEFLKDSDSQSYTKIDKAYLQSLPVGDTKGPDPVELKPWIDMNYGNVMSTTIEFGSDGTNIAQKAIAIRLDPGPGGISKGNTWMAFEHDTMRWAAGWKGTGFIDWRGIQFDGAHGIHPRSVGEIHFANPTAPGWANPETGLFDDQVRVLGRDGKRYGPLPKSWVQFRGMHRDANGLAIDYSVDQTGVRERPFLIETEGVDSQVLFGRTLVLEPSKRKLTTLVATIPGKVVQSKIAGDRVIVEWEKAAGKKEAGNRDRMEATFLSNHGRPSWRVEDNRLCLDFEASTQPATHSIVLRNFLNGELSESSWQTVRKRMADEIETPFIGIHGSLRKPTESIAESITESITETDNSIQSMPRVWFEGNGWAVDDLAPPAMNPWNARTRVTGLAFYPGQDAMAVCTWDGDVWRLSGLDNLDRSASALKWQRIATGLFQPLGILVVDDCIMVTCRDQLMKLRDTDGDGLIDDYGCFNNDHQVTEHFHEFAMGLQQDASGNFYYAKSARHALKSVVPHHGTLLQVSPDGATTEIVATGFRAANGVCLNPDGSFVVTDQEGHWNPKNRINWVEPGKFYGNMFGYHSVTDSSDSAMEPPLCWITNSFDRSPAELLWVDSPRWGALDKSLLNLSYGYGRIYVVPFETVDGVKQGGMCALPIPDLPTGIVRGKFSPRDGQLYVGGMFAWASSRQDQEGGLYRVRRTGQSIELPIALNATRNGDGQPTLEIGFTDELDPAATLDPQRYTVKMWDLRRTEKYGSDHFNERQAPVASAMWNQDKKTIVLIVPTMEPTWCMSIEMKLKTASGKEIERTIHNTVHKIK
ncbi:MAG: c-type cytochrome [Pirellula sp.]|nr:c-type cytochrome [Pirellula sp.]